MAEVVVLTVVVTLGMVHTVVVVEIDGMVVAVARAHSGSHDHRVAHLGGGRDRRTSMPRSLPWGSCKVVVKLVVVRAVVVAG